jgi:putative tricarboxylic transport membrane protein
MARARAAEQALPKGSSVSGASGTLAKMQVPVREIFYALAVGAVGIFFIIQSTYIETTQDDLVGPQLVPLLVSCLIAGIAALQILGLFVAGSRGEAGEAGDTSQAGSTAADRTSGILRMAAVVALGFAYIWLFSLLGYLVSTALVLGALLFVFGNRGAVRLVLLTLGGALIYYLVFIHFMGIQDSIGWHLDLAGLGLQ